jgi:hypothetical protein
MTHPGNYEAILAIIESAIDKARKNKNPTSLLRVTTSPPGVFFRNFAATDGP